MININSLKPSILEIIKKYVVLEKRGSNNYFGICPFHFENTPSFSINLEKNYFYCFGCKEKGDVIDFLIKYKKIDFKTSISLIKKERIDNNIIIKKKLKLSELEKKLIFKINDKIKNFYFKKLNFSKKAKNYLLKRGCSKKIINLFKLGYSSFKSNIYYTLSNFSDNIINYIGLKKKGNILQLFPGRIIFPIINANLNTIGFAGRRLDFKNPKYLNSKTNFFFEKSKIFYGIWLTEKFIKKKNYVLIVEGYFDVITLFKEKFKNVLGLMGSNFTLYHIKTIFNICNNIIFCLDSDLGGNFAIKNILKLFIKNNFFYENIRFIKLPLGYDPDNFVRKFGYKNFLIKLKVSDSFQKTFYNFFIKNIFSEKKKINENLLEIKFILNEIHNKREKLLIFYILSNNKKINLKHFIFLLENNKNKYFKYSNIIFENFLFEDKVLLFIIIYPEIYFFIKDILIKNIFIFKKKFLFYELFSIIRNLNDINFIELYLFVINSKYYYYFKKLIKNNLNIKLYTLLKFRYNKLEKNSFKKKLENFVNYLIKNINYIKYNYE